MTTTVVNEQRVSLFLVPNEAISRLDEVINQLKLKLGENNQPNLLAAQVFCLALEAQKKVLAYLNDDNFYCQVPWDPATDLPSHPSLAADVAKYTELFPVSADLKALLNSFSGWSLLHHEKLPACCCGRKERPVDSDIMLNAILKSDNGSLTIKFLVGVKSGDNDHLEKHYNIKQKSQVVDGLIIIFICENRIIVNSSDESTIEVLNFSHAEQFDVSVFEGMVNKEVSKTIALA